MIFGILGPFSTKNVDCRFSVSRPLYPQNRARTLELKKVPILFFSIFLSLGCQVFFILQLDDHEDILKSKDYMSITFLGPDFFRRMAQNGPKSKTMGDISEKLIIVSHPSYPSILSSIYLSIRPSIHPLIYPSIYPFICLFIYQLSIYLFIYQLSIYLSISSYL